MKLLKGFTIFATIIFSVATFASISDITAITLNTDEVILPIHDIVNVKSGSINLFDGRSINTSQIKNFEINDSNGDSKTISKGLFNVMMMSRSGGDGSGGG